MSYPPQRPPQQSFESASGHAPLLHTGSYPAMPVPHHHPASPGPPPDGGASPSPGGSANKLRRPGWGKKDAEMGHYEELERAHAGASAFDLGGPVVSIPDGGKQPKTTLGKVYSYLISASIVTRWILFVLPILGIVWIPGILSLTTFPRAAVWGVRLIWWSVWLSVVWGGWWAALASARIAPIIIRSTVGVVAVSSRRYIEWLQALHRYVALFAWSIAVYVSFQPLIHNNQPKDGDAIAPSTSSEAAISLFAKILFAIVICATLLLFEKFAIQWIAGKFHERSYAERIAEQKFAVRTLVTLYSHSSDIPGRSDTLGARHLGKGSAVDPMRLLKKLGQGVRLATTTTATVFGNVASEIAGSSVLQPNSPQAIIKTSLESANKSRLLARRLFHSFAQNGAEYLLVGDIARFFPTKEDADAVFALFDKDGNGDASREEMEMACLEFHREQLSIENSMRDLDSAVGRLDNILMSLYVIVAALIVAVALEAQLATLVTGAGTLVLGLSWLIGGSLQEVLTSIIFLFIKHPFDVGDRVMIATQTYTVKEIRLLSTVFLDANNGVVQAPNNQLNTVFIQNMRRSPQMSETFTFNVNYATTFEDLERLRARMLAFVEAERRDYQPIFDVKVNDFPEQEKMTLSADIKYKSNFQQGALKAKRRNKWICALKSILGELKIYGPSGDPSPPPAVSRYAKVPWEIIDAEDRKKSQNAAQTLAPAPQPLDGWNLTDKNAAILDSADEVFGGADELRMTNPRAGLSSANIGDTIHQAGPAGSSRTLHAVHPTAGDVFEVRPR
ncbi:hypothetical protein HYPSUDRAFT_842053 [Hypholoma sublateritium FD-334 SS-4]|uniref:EF-hand domain-containing protein n=1 Tax=Hypholoma sublateritium (strain FD-334 SS-4) TaxID=945553 RepID=A0A0D2PIQ9_HYPSF|nr:hypothetical protein HYPSUDRAFT_842053 [Hypholoma sublateritium FD-334 SS-4]